MSPGIAKNTSKALRKRERLLQSPTHFGSILANSLDVLYRRNISTDRYDYVSPSVQALTGYSAAEFLRGRLSTTVNRVHPDDAARARRAIDEVMSSPTGRGRAEYRYRRKDGAYRWFSDYFTVIRDARGRPRYWVGTVRDITDLKKAETSLKRAHHHMESAVRQRTAQLRAMTAKLIAAEETERERIGHILHEDLQQILVWLRYAIETPSKGVSREARRAQLVDIVDKAIERTRSLSADLLPPMLAGETLREGLVRLAGDMQQKCGLAVQLKVSPAAEPSSEALRMFICRAVRELLLNIVKHAECRTAHVTVGRSGGDWIRVTLRDRGRGFDSKGIRPAGLGLFRIRERTVHFGGDMQVASIPGGGTRITLLLPKC